MSRLVRTTPALRRPTALLALLVLSPAVALAGEPVPLAAARAVPSAEDRIVYQVVPIVTGDGDVTTTTLRDVPVLARDGRLLAGEELFQRLGRPDLVAELHTRENRRNVLLGLGAAIFAGGAVYTMSDSSSASAGPAGMAVSLVGSLVMAIGILTSPSPIGEAELHRLIEEHNRALPGGGPRTGAAPASASGTQVSFQAGPMPGGAMAGLSLVF